MRKKSRIIRTLSAFTALASIITPVIGHAENNRLPTIELNFDALEKLKQQEKPVVVKQATPKKVAAKPVEKKKEEPKQTKLVKPSPEKKQVAKAKKESKKKTQVAAKKHEVEAPKIANKPPVEIKKAEEIAAPVKTETKVQKDPVIALPSKEIKHESQPEKQEIVKHEPSISPVEIQKYAEPAVVEAFPAIENAPIEEKKNTFGSMWKKVPFFSKKEEAKPVDAVPLEATPEIVEVPNIEEPKIAEAPKEESPVIVKDAEHTQAEITETKPEEKKNSLSALWSKVPFVSKKDTSKVETAPEKQEETLAEKPAENSQKEIYADSHAEEFLNEKAPGSLKEKAPALNNVSSYTATELEKHNAKEQLRQARIAARKEAAEQKIKNSLESEAVQPKHNEIEKEATHALVQKAQETAAIQPAPVKDEPKKEEPAKTIVAEKPEPTWQQFLMESKKKANQLESANPPKQTDEQINKDSIVALKPENQSQKKLALKETPKKEEEKKVAEKEVVKVVEAPAPEEPKKEEVAKITEEALKIVETQKIATPTSAPEKAAEPAKEPEPKITTNEDLPAPVIKKQDKATLSSLMDKMPYFNDNKKELKSEADIKKQEEVKKAPEIPAIHEVKSIPIEVAEEEEKTTISAPAEDQAANKSILSKMLDKKFTPTTQPSTEREVVVMNDATEKKLNDAIDTKIVATKETKEAPPVPDPSNMPIEITAPEKDTEAAATQPAMETAKNTIIDKNIVLSIAFDSNNIVVTDVDKERLTKLVSEILTSGKRFKIVSFAQGVDGEINSARRISLQRAIAVRAQMISSGLEKNRINVQAVGNNTTEQEFTNSVNIYEVQ